MRTPWKLVGECQIQHKQQSITSPFMVIKDLFSSLMPLSKILGVLHTSSTTVGILLDLF